MSIEFATYHIDTDILIREVKARPCLYARSNPKYCDQHYKRAEWEGVAKALFPNDWDDCKEEEQDAKVELVQKRWKNLRACFSREINRQKDPKWVYGVSFKRRKYLYFDEMSFLLSGYENTDEETTQDIDLPATRKNEADNTIMTIDTNIEELPIPAPSYKKSPDSDSNKLFIDESDNTKLSFHSDNTKLSFNSDNDKDSIESENDKSSIKSDKKEKSNDTDSTNFALSLVPMLNMIPIHERVDVQIQILSVLQPFMKKNRGDGKKSRGDAKKKKKKLPEKFCKTTENIIAIEIKSEGSDDETKVSECT